MCALMEVQNTEVREDGGKPLCLGAEDKVLTCD